MKILHSSATQKFSNPPLKTPIKRVVQSKKVMRSESQVCLTGRQQILEKISSVDTGTIKLVSSYIEGKTTIHCYLKSALIAMYNEDYVTTNQLLVNNLADKLINILGGEHCQLIFIPLQKRILPESISSSLAIQDVPDIAVMGAVDVERRLQRISTHGESHTDLSEGEAKELLELMCGKIKYI